MWSHAYEWMLGISIWVKTTDQTNFFSIKSQTKLKSIDLVRNKIFQKKHET